MEIIEIITGLVASAFLAGGVLAIAGLGETVTQRVGVFNLGIEGFMAMGGICAIATVATTGDVVLGSLAAAGIGILLGIFFAITTVIFRVNQVVSGLAFTFLGTGLATWAGTSYAGKPAAAAFEKAPLPGLSEIPALGEMFFNHQAPIYLVFFVLASGVTSAPVPHSLWIEHPGGRREPRRRGCHWNRRRLAAHGLRSLRMHDGCTGRRLSDAGFRTFLVRRHDSRPGLDRNCVGHLCSLPPNSAGCCRVLFWIDIRLWLYGPDVGLDCTVGIPVVAAVSCNPDHNDHPSLVYSERQTIQSASWAGYPILSRRKITGSPSVAGYPVRLSWAPGDCLLTSARRPLFICKTRT